MSELDDLKARKAEREAKRADEKQAREIEVLRLEEKLEHELGGPRGSAFQILDIAGEPLVAVKPNGAVLYKRLQESKVTQEDIHMFVVACLVCPDKQVFAGVVERRAGVLGRCLSALVALYRGEAEEEAKK